MNTDAIFNAIGKASAYVCVQDQLHEKAAQLRRVQARRCGNCYHWMKSSCVPEKKQKQFKSCDSLSCCDFELSDLGGLIPRFEKEVEELKERLAAF